MVYFGYNLEDFFGGEKAKVTTIAAALTSRVDETVGNVNVNEVNVMLIALVRTPTFHN